MDNQHNMMLQHQQRNQFQSHDNAIMPQQRPVAQQQQRPSSRPRSYRNEEYPAAMLAGGGSPASGSASDQNQQQQQSGHIIQSRTSSTAHVLNKRSRSRGRRRPKSNPRGGGSRQQRPVTPQNEYNKSSDSNRASLRRTSSVGEDLGGINSSSSLNNNNSSMHSMGYNSSNNNVEGKFNEQGRCPRHPTIELASRDSIHSPWRVLLQDCPLCSLDGSSGLQTLARPNNRNTDGGSSSQVTTAAQSTKTNRTLTTAEETEGDYEQDGQSSADVKSWTMSDASDSENEGTGDGSKNSGGMRRTSEISYVAVGDEEPYTQRGQQQNQNQQRFAPPPRASPPPPKEQQMEDSELDTINYLKELGRKLVTEFEQQQQQPQMGGGLSGKHRVPPPPPRRENLSTTSISSLSTKELSQMRRQQKQRNANRSSGAIRTRGSTGTGVQNSGMEESNESILDEASDIIARMESLPEVPQQTPASLEASERLAEEKRLRAQRRKEKKERKQRKERKAAKLKAQQLRLDLQQQHLQQQQQHIQAEETYEMPMNDEPTRGRAALARGGVGAAGGTDDILQAAAAIRARARRSTSRSRERVKEASIFCGENPPVDDYDDDNDNNDGMADHLSLSSEKKRSILNPHGLEEPPPPVTMERRSQSRERRRRSKSGGRKQTGSVGKQRRSSSRGRQKSHLNNADIAAASNNYMQNTNQMRSATEELLNRRREMRQKIAERQSNADQSRQEHINYHRRSTSGGASTRGGEDFGDEAKSYDTKSWGRTFSDAGDPSQNQRRGRERGNDGQGGRSRSRSAVRDGISKIRSASLKPFKKKIGKGIPDLPDNSQGVTGGGGGDDMTLDSGKRSTSSSIRRLLSKGKPRSLSRGRSRGSGWGAKSETELIPTSQLETEYGDGFDSRSARSAKSTASSKGGGARGLLRRSLSKGRSSKKPTTSKGGTGLIRSLSRGSFRDGKHNDSNHLGAGVGHDDGYQSFDNIDHRSWDARSDAKSESLSYYNDSNENIHF